MSITQNQDTPTFEAMWSLVERILGPVGMTPDKASLDYGQVFWLYSELLNADNSFLDKIQIQVLKNELAYLVLEKMIN